jgi:photosystem II stability/assembly factor-like uncharacterized protein
MKQKMTQKLTTILFVLCLFNFAVSAQTQWQDLTPKGWTGTFSYAKYVKGGKLFIISIGNQLIYESIDNGKTFTFKTLPTAGLTSIDFYPDSTRGFYTSFKSLYHTSDAGSTWQVSAFSGIPSTMSLHLVWIKNEDTVLVAAHDAVNSSAGEDFIFLSADKGKTFKQVASGLISNILMNNVYDFHFATPLHGFAYARGYYAETIDGGNTWTKKLLSDVNDQDTYVTDMPNGKAIWERNSNSIMISDDGDPSKAVETYHSDIQILESQVFGSTIYNIDVKNNGAIVFITSSDGGQTWSTVSNLSKGYGYTYMSFLNKNIGVIVGSNLVTLVTFDGGKTWTQSNFKMGDGFESICTKSKDECFIGGKKGRLFRTINGGTTWTFKDLGVNKLSQITFPTKDTGFVSSTGSLYRTLDGGNTWTPIVNQTNGLHLNFPTKDIGYMGFDGFEAVQKTTDGGATWNSTDDYFYDVNIWNAQYMYFKDILHGVVYSAKTSQLLYTNDGGITWGAIDNMDFRYALGVGDNWLIVKQMEKEVYLCDKDFNCNKTLSGVTSNFYNPSYRDANTIYLPTSSNTNYVSKDGGNSWLTETDTLDPKYSFAENNTIYILNSLSSDDRIYKKSYLSQTHSTTTLSSFTQTGRNVSFILNNANNSSFATTIEVLQGTSIVSSVTKQITSGNTVTVDLSALPIGTYTINVVPTDSNIGEVTSQSFTLETGTGIQPVSALKEYYKVKGNTLYFLNNETVVYSLLGQQLSASGISSINLAKGCYIVRTPMGTDKIVILQ